MSCYDNFLSTPNVYYDALTFWQKTSTRVWFFLYKTREFHYYFCIELECVGVLMVPRCCRRWRHFFSGLNFIAQGFLIRSRLFHGDADQPYFFRKKLTYINFF